VVCDDYVPEWFHGIFPERKGEMMSYFQELKQRLLYYSDSVAF
jgi:hypothetical protein